MAIIESTAAFRSRALVFGISEPDINLLKAQAMNTFAAFAFLVPYNPAISDDKELKEALKDILGSEPGTAGMARFRRLQFESHTMVLSDTKLRVERTDETTPRKLPAAERAARHRDQVARLVSIQITQDNEPSHALLDLAQQMVEDSLIRHITLDKCTSRVHELQGIKVDTGIIKDSSGAIREVDKEAGPSADLSSDYRIRQAFLRRSLALDQATLIGFHTHERWVNSLYAAMGRTPPPKFQHVSLEQILAADRELFILLGEECRDGVGIDGSGVPLVAKAMITLMTDSKISFLLQPLQGHTFAPRQQIVASGTAAPVLSNRARQAAAKAKARAIAPYVPPPAFPPVPPAVVKGKGKGKGKVNMPAAVVGCSPQVDGKRACFGFNLGSCTAVAVGEECFRGLHKCCGQGCGGLHSYAQCPARAAPP